MNYHLTIQAEDYGFIVEAIKLRTISILESFDMQLQAQLNASIAPAPAPKQEPVAAEAPPAKKRVYRKTKAAKKRAPSKAAPYGYKKDGTPKKALGRPSKGK